MLPGALDRCNTQVCKDGSLLNWEHLFGIYF